jgi:hypothetical protein
MYKLERLIAAVTEQLQLLTNGKPPDAAPDDFGTAADGCLSRVNSAEHNGRGED